MDVLLAHKSNARELEMVVRLRVGIKVKPRPPGRTKSALSAKPSLQSGRHLL